MIKQFKVYKDTSMIGTRSVFYEVRDFILGRRREGIIKVSSRPVRDYKVVTKEGSICSANYGNLAYYNDSSKHKTIRLCESSLIDVFGEVPDKIYYKVKHEKPKEKRKSS